MDYGHFLKLAALLCLCIAICVMFVLVQTTFNQCGSELMNIDGEPLTFLLVFVSSAIELVVNHDHLG